MTQFLARYRRFLAIVGRVELVIGGALLLFMAMLITTQVILRSGFGRPLTWMEEMVTYTLVWLTFIGASIGLKQRRHVTISSFLKQLPARYQLYVRVAATSIIIVLLFLLIYYARQIIPIESSATTVALPLDLPRSLFFSVALLVNSILMQLTMFYYLLIDVAELNSIKIATRAIYPSH